MENWVQDLQSARRSGDELAEAGLVAAEEAAEVERVRAVYQVQIPPSYLAAIERPDPSDPIWRTVVPRPEELHRAAAEDDDPTGDAAHSPVKGVVHRYPDRALLLPTHACAVYCRYCFRRAAVGQAEAALTGGELEAALGHIERDPRLWEVILTGGDPLILSDAKLDEILGRLRACDHVKVLRVHTRVPAVLPSRVTTELVEILAPRGRPRKPVWVVLHVNHVQEITPAVEEACERLADRGIPLLNQSVLLRGVNDTLEAQEALLRRLVELRIRPYYLHHADLAPGTTHFRTSLEEGRALTRALRGRLSGLCQPLYVLDIPGGHGKVPAGPSWLTRDGDGWQAEDPEGHRHRYPPTGAAARTSSNR